MLRLLTLLLCAFPGFAQSTDAAVSGTVSDPTGASIAGVAVVATNSETGVATRTTSNESGVYVFPALQPGVYRFEAEHAGFRKAAVTSVDLEVSARLTLNLSMELGSTSEVVEVQSATTELAYATSSVGSVVAGRKILELPLAGRSTYDLISTQAGVYGANVGGNRTGSLNITTDGVNTQDNLLNGMFYVGVANQARVDRVEEFRIITSPADAELGRGSGQIQLLTRSGTNSYRGSLWEEHRNTALTANEFFNNSRGNDPITGQQISPRNILIRNQYGGRLGGPIRKNRTFFHGNYDGERQRQRNAVTTTVLTEPARRGIYRYYPGARNANANALIPTVDLQGNPVRPAGAGELQSLNVFGRDPSRPVADPSGTMQKLIGLTPLPNNYRGGDGLNSAGFTWQRPVHVNFESFETRVDHIFTAANRIAITYSHQAYDSLNVAGPARLPGLPGGRGPTETSSYSITLTSILRPTLLNELRIGIFRPRTEIVANYDPQAGGPDVLPKAGGITYIPDFASFDELVAPTNYGGDNSNRLSPVYQIGNNVSWLRGKHSFKGGVEARFISSAGYDAYAVTPRATIGAGFAPVQNINNIADIGQNAGGAQALLLDLTGSLGNAFQVVNSPGGANPAFLPGETRYRNWSQHEYSFFFKDDYKVTPNLTLNLGVRYEWYAVPHERLGRGLAPVGSGAGLFGITGTSYADLFQPGRLNGSLTAIQLIGPRTPNPGVKLYDNDNNNFAPAVGLAYSLPWFGRNKTVFRAGYGIGYERNPIYLAHTVSGLEPGLSETAIRLVPGIFNMVNLQLPVQPAGAPLAPIPLTGRTLTITGFDRGLRTPYIQNWNFSLVRSLPRNFSLDIRYVGSKGTRLVREANVNEFNTIENGILEAYQITQAGGNSPLLNRIFNGLGGVNGTTMTGSDLLRGNGSTQGFFANNDVGGFANFLGNSNLLTGVNGGFLRRVGLPENFVTANPQVARAMLTGNLSNSTYHSLQVELMKRFTSGWTFQGNYTWSRTIGDYDGEDAALESNFRTLRNRNLDKKLLSYHRSHIWRSNGIYELPFGPGKTFGRNLNGVAGRIIGGWQTGLIFNMFSGEPVTFGAVNAFNAGPVATPIVEGTPLKGSVRRTGNGVAYFSGFRQIPDPHIARITTTQGIQTRSALRAITDASGKLLLRNPEPGQFGTLAPRTLYGPGAFRLDVNLIKRIKITERIELHLRADAINFTNSPMFGNPVADINSLNFGVIGGTSTQAGNAQSRIVVLQTRVSW